MFSAENDLGSCVFEISEVFVYGTSFSCINRWQLLCFRDSGLEMLACVMRTSIPNYQRLRRSNGSRSSSHTVLLRICVSHARPRRADLRFNLPPQSCQTAVKMWTAASKRGLQ